MSDKIADHARRWLNGPLPADLMADLADIVEDDEYDAEKRAHQVVWQALKWMIEEALDANYGAEREAERKRAEKAEAEVRRLQEAGQAVLLARDWHHHEPSADDVDTCRVCGRDVRHPVHLGEGPRDLVERDAVENLRAALGEGGQGD